jgi:alanyl-tRNA synthetase
MTSHEIRAKFLDFFASKGHKIVPSAPVVRKNDPTLMFTNSGMAPFKDCFLGNLTPPAARVADSQKCLRVSGKHNDLEDVGLDGTHHTLFEMLGNWSFSDYFKKEALEWSWELLTKEYGLSPDRLYVSVFEGDASENLAMDSEAYEIWQALGVPTERILMGNKKDNFWEMGEQGPCGPCSEIHYDMRPDAARAKGDGASLVNVDDSGVVEIWNNVFMQFNRKADKSLEVLPAQHVDTGMGFERLCVALQGKTVTYETDVFTPYLQHIERVSGKKYTGSFDRNAKTDIAMRVCADHIRAVAFTIADGQLPASNGAGYVIRRILRRAVRYYFSFLDIKEPFMATMVPILAEDFATVFPELYAQKDFVEKVISEEERSFLRTLESGLKRLDALFASLPPSGELKGASAFELLDTFGFPIDLTELIAAEKGFKVDMEGFKIALQAQKDRSKIDAAKSVGDWCLPPAPSQGGGDAQVSESCEFVGYEQLQVRNAKVIKYRIVEDKKGLQYQIVLTRTPFYGESGGQAGDSGYLLFDGGERVEVLDTKKENDLIIHIVNKLPENIEDENIFAQVNTERRQAISGNHTGAHLLHAAIHEVIGHHAVQKGQSVDEHRLRFDISHFQACTKAELAQIERLVNQKIRENIALDEQNMAIEDARKTGAMMLFGEKYGETVRVIAFDKKFSIELCGGTHVQATGELGYFKIISESALAAGVRRIEAVTAEGAQAILNAESSLLNNVKAAFKNPKDLEKAITDLQDKLKAAEKKIEEMGIKAANDMQNSLKNEFSVQNGINLLIKQVDIADAKALKALMGNLEREKGNAVLVFGTINNEKPQLTIQISENLTKTNNLHAGNLVREAAKLMNGGGGGQAMFATAGGTDAGKLAEAMDWVKNSI